MPVEPIIFGPFRLNPENGTLSRKGELVAIGQKSALILAAPVEAPWRRSDQRAIAGRRWPGTAIEESNLLISAET